MIEHCVSLFLKEQEEKRYRAYVTDTLMLISENTARFVSEGKYMNRRWADALKPQDNRTGDEIAAEVILNAGLRFQEEE